MDTNIILPEKDEVEIRNKNLRELRECIKNNRFGVDDELMRDIDEKIKKIEDLEKEQEIEAQKIIPLIKETLESNDISYLDISKPKNTIMVSVCDDNIPIQISISTNYGRVTIRHVFSFRTQSNSLVLAALKLFQLHEGREFSSMEMNLNSGEISLSYSYLITTAEQYDSEHFYTYLMTVLENSQDMYKSLHRLAVGRLLKEEIELYLPLIKESLSVVQGEEMPDDEVYFGYKGLMNKLQGNNNFFGPLVIKKLNLDEYESLIPQKECDIEEIFPFDSEKKEED